MLLCLRSQATRGVRFSQSLQRGQRGKVDLSRFPPWRRWPKAGIQRIKNWKLPEVEPAFDLFACDDPKLVADALSEVVPWKRKRFHHEWLHRACTHLRTLLPEMEPPDVLRVILAFGELYTKRRRHSLLFQDYETYTQLFQALPIDAATEKSLLPLMRCYRRMGVLHEPFVSAMCNRVVEGEVELTPSQLSELVQIHGDLKIKSPRLFTFASEMLDLRFAYFSEDQVGDIARTFCQLRHHCPVFLATLRRELPMRLHEYAWWNLIDIGEMYLYLQVDDRDIIERIANEVYKLIFSMKYSYPARALKILAFLDVGDKRTLRLLIRSVPRTISFLTPQGAAETLIAFATLDVKPKDIFHRVRAWKIYLVLMKKLLPNIGSLSPKMTCDVLAAVAKAGQKEAEFVQHVEAAVNERPYKYHAEHLISMLRDLSLLKASSAPLRTHLMQRHFELADCTPSALCALPTALAGHPAEGDQEEMEHKMLTTMSQLLTKPGAYKLPKDGRMFRAKDDFWWEQLRQRHFRLRRRAKEAGVTVAPAPKSAAGDEDADEAAPAVIHVTRQECLQLVQGCAKMGWRDESLLQGTAAWLCEGRRHAELSPSEVASLLGAFSELGYSSPLLRAALEHALLRVASAIPPASCTEAVQGAVDAGMSVRSTAVRSLLKRCTSQLRQLPEKDAEKLRELASAILKEAEEEVLHSQGAIRLPRAEPLRLPLDLQLFREAVATQLGPTVSSG